MSNTKTTRRCSGFLMEKYYREAFHPRKNKLVVAWIELHKDELMADWQLAARGQQPYKIDPLK